MVEAVKEIQVEDGTGGRVGAEEAMGIRKGGLDSTIKAARDGDTKLTGREKNAGKDIRKEKGVDGGGDADPRDANADRAEFAAIASGILVESSEVS